MKKVKFPLLLSFLFLTSCNDTVENSSLQQEQTSYYENPAKEMPILGPQMTVISYFYNPSDKIHVTVKGVDYNDWVGIYSKDKEPGEGTESIVWTYTHTDGTYDFSASSLGGYGEYYIYLCDNNQYDVYQKRDVYIKDPKDTNDYQIKSAKFIANKENGVSNMKIEVTPSSTKELTYVVYWTENGIRLPDYTALKKINVKDSNKFEIELNDCLFIPEAANGIEISVLQGNSNPYYIEIDESFKRYKSDYLYSFQVISDLHIQDWFPKHISHLKMALTEIPYISSNSKAIFTTGDNVNRTTKEEYTLLSNIIYKYKDKIPNIYYSMGNHDYMYLSSFETATSQFLEQTKMDSTYYSVEIENNKFIVLASDEAQMEGVMGKTQIEWLKNQLKNTNKNDSVFIFMHQPLKDTVSGSLKTEMNQNWYGFRNNGDEIKEIINQYPNAVVFSGHTHWTLDSYQPALYGNKQSATYVNCASLGYLWNDDDKEEIGSEGIYVDVYKDYVLIKGREFLDKKWVSAAQFLFPKAK